MMWRYAALVLIIASSAYGSLKWPDPQGYVLGSKKISIPEYPDAFNPSIISFNGKNLLSFRHIANPKDPYNTSYLGLVWLNSHFNPISPPQILALPISDANTARAEDGRLIECAGKLYIIYSDNENAVISKSGFRVRIAELNLQDGLFSVVNVERLEDYEKADSSLREKNWTPFDFEGNLFLSYSLNPHLVFKPLFGTDVCETVFNSSASVEWPWGILRGGTQSLRIKNFYLTFFHSCIEMDSEASFGKPMLHYFMGAASFDTCPPFKMTNISLEPIISEEFFSGPLYPPYFGSWRGVFPGGFIFDNKFIWVVYGKQNHELWVVKLDQKGLFESLIPVAD